MSTAQRMTEQAKEQAAARLSESVLDVAYVNRCGTLSTIVESAARCIATDAWDQPLGGLAVPKDEIHREGAKAIPLPHAFLLVVTPSKIHVFSIRMIMGRVKLKEEIAVFERAGLELGVHDEMLVILFRMRAPRQGQDMAFEITKSQYARDFASLLRR